MNLLLSIEAYEIFTYFPFEEIKKKKSIFDLRIKENKKKNYFKKYIIKSPHFLYSV